MSFSLFKRESAGEIHIEPADFEWLSDYLHQDERTSTSPVLPLPSQTLLGGSKHLSEKQALLSPLSPAFFKLDRGDDPSVSLRKAEWRPDEDLVILATFRRLGTQWGRIAAQLPGRTSDGVRNRWHRLQRRHGLGESLEGRRALDELLLSCGIDKNWMPPSDPLVSLDEDEKNADHGRTMWTTEEDAIIREGVRQHGFKWRQIAASLPGRSDSSVRNRWRRLEKEQGGASPDSKVEGDESAGEGSPASPALSPLRADSAAAAADSQLFSPPKRQRTVDAAMPSGAAAAAVPVGPPIRRAVTAPGAVAPLRPRPAPVRVDSDLVDLVNVAVEEEWSPLRDLARTLEDFPEYAPGEPSTSGAREPSPFRDQSIMSALSSSSTAVNSDHDDDDDADGANRKRFRPMWTGEEDMFIVRYVEQHGRLWSKIAELMEGRSHRAVRNRWLRMQKGQATREKRGPDNGYRCRRCGELKLGHICSAGMATPPNPPSFNL